MQDIVFTVDKSDQFPPALTEADVLQRLRRNIPNWDTLAPEVQQYYLKQGITLARQIHEMNLKIYLLRTPAEGTA